MKESMTAALQDRLRNILRKARAVRFEHPRTGLLPVAIDLHKPVIYMLDTRPESFQPVFICEITVLRGRLHYSDGSSHNLHIPSLYASGTIRGWDRVRKIMDAVGKRIMQRNRVQ